MEISHVILSERGINSTFTSVISCHMIKFVSKVSSYVLCLFVCISCTTQKKDKTVTSEISKDNTNQYPTQFSLSPIAKGITVLKIQAGEALPESQQFTLVSQDANLLDLPDSLKGIPVLNIPLKRVVSTSTTHLPALEMLGEAESLKGFAGLSYISSPVFRDRASNGLIEEIGANESLNTEIILSLKPEAVLGFTIGASTPSYDRLRDWGIPVIAISDWTESHPLSRAAWLKVFGALFEKDSLAQSLVKDITLAYDDLKNLSVQTEKNPTVMSGAMLQDVWYLPAGNSWLAQLIKDAGGAYLWNDSEGNGSLALSFESVLERAVEADYWLGTAQFTSYKEMMEANRRYRYFKPFVSRKAFTIALKTEGTGGVPFYELGPVRPDLILKDLVSILHPDLVPDHHPVYFKPLAEDL